MFLRFNSQLYKYIFVFLVTLFSNFISISQESNDTFKSDSLRANNFLKKLQEHYKNGDYILHKNYSDSLLLVSKKNKLTKMHVLALVNQGVYYKNRSEEHKTIDLYHEALTKCKLIPDDFRTKTLVLVNLGNIYNRIGSFKKAIKTMKQVLLTIEHVDNSDMIKAAALIGLCNNYTDLNLFKKAIDYANEVKIIGEKTKNESITVTALNVMSTAYINQKNYKKAIVVLNEALELEYLQKTTQKKAGILLDLGSIYFKLDEIDRAIAFLNEAKKIAIEKNLLEIKMESFSLLAKIYEKKGNYKKSNIEQKKYIAAREFYLKNKKEATEIDLNQEIKNTNANLFSIKESNKRLILWTVFISFILVSILVFYINRNKTIKKEQQTLRGQYTNLKKTNTNLEIQSKETIAGNTLKENPNTNISSYENSSLTKQDRLNYKNHILDYMRNHKPYLNSDLKQSELADKLNLSSHHFSEVLNFTFEQNFYNFVNFYRIIEAQELIKKPGNKKTKIFTIAFESGFKSKASFNRVFKKHTGLTPSEYKETI